MYCSSILSHITGRGFFFSHRGVRSVNDAVMQETVDEISFPQYQFGASKHPTGSGGSCRRHGHHVCCRNTNRFIFLDTFVSRGHVAITRNETC
jgi:hypothetical protein